MAKDGIVILDADTGNVIDANPFMNALLGHSHDEFLGSSEVGVTSPNAKYCTPIEVN